jgi:23S rRNA pseudouridine1911/1915/1917 synthase
MKHLNAPEATTLKEFLASALQISKGKAKELIDSRNVFVNDQRVWMAGHRLQRGDRVECNPQTLDVTPARRLAVLYEDDYIIAVNKPAGVLSDEAGDSIESQLRVQSARPALKAIHRLDRDTSGVHLLAKTNEAFERYKTIWRRQEVEKTYQALCYNRAKYPETQVRLPIDGKPAVSDVRVLRNGPGCCYLQITTRFGRKHQVRVHLNTIRHPVIGDKTYGVKVIDDPALKKISRQMLHCWRITLPRLSDERSTQIIAPLPGDFRQLGRRLGLIRD